VHVGIALCMLSIRMHVSTVRIVPVYIRFHGLVFSSGYVALVWRSGIGFRLFMSASRPSRSGLCFVS
jgi:hypothetical protein